MQAKSDFKSFSPTGQKAQKQFNTISEINAALDNIFARLDRIEQESIERRRELLSLYTLPQLAQIAADNSNPRTGDRYVMNYVVAEIEARQVCRG